MIIKILPNGQEVREERPITKEELVGKQWIATIKHEGKTFKAYYNPDQRQDFNFKASELVKRHIVGELILF